jgi:hypothetical protein
VRKADLTLLRNLATLTSWNPLGHSRPVTGLFYLYLYSTKDVHKICLREYECHESWCKENLAPLRSINKFLCVTSSYLKRRCITYYLDLISNSAGSHMGETKTGERVLSLYTSLCSISHQKPKI